MNKDEWTIWGNSTKKEHTDSVNTKHYQLASNGYNDRQRTNAHPDVKFVSYLCTKVPQIRS